MEKQWQQIADLIADRVSLVQKSVLTAKEASAYLGMSLAQLHRLTAQKRIPYSKPGGKLAYFNREELDAWALSNRIPTNEELTDVARSYSSTRR